MPDLDPPFAAALEAGRERLNARFAQARRDAPSLDGGVFLAHLRDAVGPVLKAVEPVHLPRTLEVLYGVLLALLARGHVGPRARTPDLEAAWARLLVALGPVLGRNPDALAGPLTNALVNIRSTAGARAGQWSGLVAALAPDAPDPDTLLKLGQLAAWRAGMAMYRPAALELAAALPAELVARVLQPAEWGVARLPETLKKLSADPWFDPFAEATPGAGAQVAAEVGGFRGLGGPFARPPLVAVKGDALTATDGQGTWVVSADAFGAVLTRHRAGAAHPGDAAKPALSLAADGTVSTRRGKSKLPLLAGAASSAAAGPTLAVTLPHSHRVFLVTGPHA